MNVFTEQFLECENSNIVEEVRNKGFFKFENALTQEFINNINNDVKKADLSLNKNNVAGVYFTHGNQFFLTHMLMFYSLISLKRKVRGKKRMHQIKSLTRIKVSHSRLKLH